MVFFEVFFLFDVICDGKFIIEGGVCVFGVGGSFVLIFFGFFFFCYNKLNVFVSVDIVNWKWFCDFWVLKVVMIGFCYFV